MEVRRMLAGLLLAGAAMGVAGVAGLAEAQTPWLMDYLEGWYSDPVMINAEQPTTITLWGWFPYDCGVVDNVAVIDSAHVEFALSQGPACDDTARVWHQSFALGLLPAGYHTLHLRRAFYSTDGSGIPHVADGELRFYVEPSATPPPPSSELPDLGSVQVRCLSGWFISPDPATDHTYTTLELWGWFPYHCGFVANATVLAQDHVAVTLRRGPACTDTARTWSVPLGLGALAPGENVVHVDLTVLDDPRDTTGTRTATIVIPVGNEPVSAVVPNPFVDRMSFSVNHREAGPVRVDVYDPRGRHVTELFAGELPAGMRSFTWDGTRAGGERVPIGIYFSRVAMDGRMITRRLVLLPR